MLAAGIQCGEDRKKWENYSPVLPALHWGVVRSIRQYSETLDKVCMVTQS